MTDEPDAPKLRTAKCISLDSTTARDIEWIKTEFGATTTSEVVRRAVRHLTKSLKAEAVYFEVDGVRQKANLQ